MSKGHTMSVMEGSTPTCRDEVERLANLMDLRPTLRRLLTKLADGKHHQSCELQTCLDDEMSGDEVLQVHVCLLRKKLRARGEDVATERLWDRTWYRWVRTVRVAD